MAQQAAAPAATGMSGHASHGPRTQLATGVAFGPDGSLWMVGLDAKQQLYTANSTDLATWSTPHVLDVSADPISADGENRP